VRAKAGVHRVYNLEVDTDHCHFVSRLAVLSHNAGAKSCGAGGSPAPKGLSAAESWGNPKTLARHFRDHGADFAAKTAEEYAQKASQFLQDAQRRGLATKVDAEGIIRVYDPKTNTFGAYNPNGTTRTFFKPTSPTYWDRQPDLPPRLLGGH
jgi:hypothetical protein